VTEHAEAIEADLLRYYGVDLLDYHRGRLTARRLRVLLRHLPREAALPAELHGDDARWGLPEHLLAIVGDQLALGNWMFATAHAAEGSGTPDRPRPIPRPGTRRPAPASRTELAAFFGPPSGD
jgi:hypothetical protein